jgi:glutathione synthase/RimK-type ligase-like ATP-grasp enzyme
MNLRVLVLTDISEYGAEATLFPLLRGLAVRNDVDEILLADRAIEANAAFYAADDLVLRKLHVRRVDARYSFENQHSYPVEAVPVADIDAVWLRLDLASDEFLHHVERLWAGRFISNRPAGIIRTGTKAFLLSLQPLMGDLMPKIKLCYDLQNVREFQRQCPRLVLKVLHSFGGKGVVRCFAEGACDLATDEDIAAFFDQNGTCLAMDYLDHPHQSDNRLIVSNGTILGALARVPKPGDWRCNITAGGGYDATEADARELDIVRRIDPAMRQLGIHFYGVDTLMDKDGKRYLSEINTMNAGGAYRYELRTGKPVCATIADDFAANALTALSHSGRPAAPLR